jgi:two-component system, sensor histidine kinase and response regulator
MENEMEASEKTREELLNDLDTLQKAYNDLLLKEERYRLLAEHARDVIWTQKLDGTISYISPAVEELRGLTVEEAMNQPVEQILTPESLAISARYFQELISDNAAGLPLKSFRGEIDYYKKDGSILNTEVITYPVMGSIQDSVLILGVTRDITERKQFEKKLKDQANKLKELNATKDKFFSIIGHDLRNPFNGIMGFSELLMNEAQGLDPDLVAQYATIINSASKQAYRLLENLLDWAKMQQGTILYAPASFSLTNIVTDEVENFKYISDQKDISLENDINKEILVYADEKMIRTVLRNLISNAIKFTPKNGKIRIAADIKNGQAEVSVSDTGIGMSPETIDKLFSIQTSFTTYGTENEKGSGLGLVLCKEFVEKHGGKITVESEQGKGSRFCFSLQCAALPTVMT